MASFEELKSNLTSNGGVMSITMEELRDAHGVFRLGVHVRKNIHDRLQGMGIGHYPELLPEYQDKRVRLYTLGGPVANAMADLLTNLTDEADQRIRERLSANNEYVLQKIRELVCE